MSGTKRARTQQQDGTLDHLPGREHLLLASPEIYWKGMPLDAIVY
jgi:hypothetical protein